MRFIADHDYHIHSTISGCCADPNQTPENILKLSKESGFKKIVLTDHAHTRQDYDRIITQLPLPQDKDVEFKFGVEVDIHPNLFFALDEDKLDEFDFLTVATTHFHLYVHREHTLKTRVKLYEECFDRLLNSSLPFGKVGIAHLACTGVATTWDGHLQVMDMISDQTFERLFKESAKKGLGIEVNFPVFDYPDDEVKHILRPYQIAKDCGCKFFLGSDSHSNRALKLAKANFERQIDLLGLEEKDKFTF